MKKLLLLIVAALVSFASCKKDNGPDLGTRPVEPSAEVSDFFEENLDAFTWQVLYENGIEPRTNACIVINSVEELPKFSPAFPVFDFETHTLVVGRVMTPVPGYRLLSQGIDTGPETMILNLVVVTLLGGCQKDALENTDPATRAALGEAQRYYYCDGVKIPLMLNDTKMFVLTKSAKWNDIKTFDSRQAKAIRADEIVYSAPYFKTYDGADIGITNILEVRVEDAEAFTRLTKLAEEYNFVIWERNESDTSIYTLECTKETKGNALDIANMLHEVGGFKYAAADFIVDSHAGTVDSYYGSQWGLKNNSYPPVDINYEEAMARQFIS